MRERLKDLHPVVAISCDGKDECLTFALQAGEENPRLRNAAPRWASTESEISFLDPLHAVKGGPILEELSILMSGVKVGVDSGTGWLDFYTGAEFLIYVLERLSQTWCGIIGTHMSSKWVLSCWTIWVSMTNTSSLQSRWQFWPENNRKKHLMLLHERVLQQMDTAVQW